MVKPEDGKSPNSQPPNSQPPNGRSPNGQPPNSHPPNDNASSRKWIGVHFQCCRIYTRIYLNRQQTAYEGHCPKCLRKVCVSVGPDGTHERIFRAW